MAGLVSQRLSSPPYLQVALDTTDLHFASRIVSRLPDSFRVLVEIGTPLIKSEGVKVANELKRYGKGRFVVADMKTLGTGNLEADIAFRGGADAATVSGRASQSTIEGFITECRELGIYSILDCEMVDEPPKMLSALKARPDVVNLHRGIDDEGTKHHLWGSVMAIKKNHPGVLVSVSGGLDKESASEALRWGADIIVMGRFITDAEDMEDAIKGILRLLEEHAAKG